MPTLFHLALLAAFPLLAIAAALKDLTSFTIPNGISAGLAAGFLAMAVVVAMPLPILGLHLLVGAVALTVGVAMFAAGWVGGGDAKLLAACSLWLGWPATQMFLLDTAVAGGVFAMVLLTLRAPLVRAHTPVLNGWPARLTMPGEPAPYGVAIAVGALAAFPAGDLMQLLHQVH
jgi:prepilin peptidase CpaA